MTADLLNLLLFFLCGFLLGRITGRGIGRAQAPPDDQPWYSLRRRPRSLKAVVYAPREFRTRRED